MTRLSEERLQTYLPEVRSYLVQAARNQSLVSYLELANAVGTSRGHIGDVLDALDIEEHERQHPLISAIVVYKHRRTPGPGFFAMTRFVESDHHG